MFDDEESQNLIEVEDEELEDQEESNGKTLGKVIIFLMAWVYRSINCTRMI